MTRFSLAELEHFNRMQVFRLYSKKERERRWKRKQKLERHHRACMMARIMEILRPVIEKHDMELSGFLPAPKYVGKMPM